MNMQSIKMACYPSSYLSEGLRGTIARRDRCTDGAVVWLGWTEGGLLG